VRPIQHYRIYYGILLDNLDTQVDTHDDSTTWELRGLMNGTQYFVAVKAVDTNGLESDEMSTVIAATPMAPDPCAEIDCGEHGECVEGNCVCINGYRGILCDIEPEPFAPEPPIPGVPPTTVPTNGAQIQATPFESGMLLSWVPFTATPAFAYKVFIGVSPGNYIDYLVTPDNRTSVTIADLINGPAAPSPVPYETAPIYHEELARIPTTDKTGPEVLWVIAVSLLFASFLYRHKRRILSTK
jgi:hypothetical protein